MITLICLAITIGWPNALHLICMKNCETSQPLLVSPLTNASRQVSNLQLLYLYTIYMYVHVHCTMSCTCKTPFKLHCSHNNNNYIHFLASVIHVLYGIPYGANKLQKFYDHVNQIIKRSQVTKPADIIFYFRSFNHFLFDATLPLGQRSMYNTIVTDPGSPYVATFQCAICFCFKCRIFYRL